MKDHIVDSGVGTIRGIGYDIFAAWMQDKQVSVKCISGGAMKGMEHFVANWENLN